MTQLATQDATEPARIPAPATASDEADGGAAPAVGASAAPVALRIERVHDTRATIDAAAHDERDAEAAAEPVIRIEDVHFYYSKFRAVKDVSIQFAPQKITALIGPSGCGKSTLLRTINRMNDLIPGTRVEGKVLYHGVDLYDAGVDAVEVRRRIGMVFQKPNPFPKSIYDNIAFGPRIIGAKGNMDEIVESSLRRAALWDDVKDKLKQSGLALSGGQQQRLCIARAIATSPDVILMDEPCSALDPRSTLQIEELMFELKQNYTIIIVTHNMQQAARASDYTVFLNMADDRAGFVVEEGPTLGIFTNPTNQLTEDYVSGRFG
ncbi:MAG TPA: phosphate ABC transporter ATP-binding protein PstB [Candidatus Limnocylindrales bacterium]|jgi:phosphate transport system ATP-binding protein